MNAVLRRIAILLGAAVLPLQGANACTSFLLRAVDGSPVYGRTMEFGVDTQSAIAVIPRGFAMQSMALPNNGGARWTTKFGHVGVNAFGMPFLIDGINEKGLVGGTLYFPGYAGYAEPKAAGPGTAIAPWEMVSFALGQFSTVAEAKAGLAKISVVGTAFPSLEGTPPFHYTFHDATGASMVVEPIGGALKFYDNPLGVMTNSPPFDWHLTNLSNYVKISPVNAAPLDLNGVQLTPLGQGSGLLGVPGDPTPPSRFVRALGYVQSAKPEPDGPSTVRLAEHLLNNFDLPVGFVRSRPGENTPLELTQWSTIADLRNLHYYVKTYDNQQLRSVDLMAQDLDGKTMRTAPLPSRVPVPPLDF